MLSSLSVHLPFSFTKKNSEIVIAIFLFYLTSSISVSETVTSGAFDKSDNGSRLR